MTTDIVINFKSLTNNLTTLIDISGYKNEYIAKKIGMTSSTFSVKKGRKSFSLEEIEKIIKVIDNEDVENHMMLEIMRSRKKDENVSLKDAKKLLGWK